MLNEVNLVEQKWYSHPATSAAAVTTEKISKSHTSRESR